MRSSNKLGNKHLVASHSQCLVHTCGSRAYLISLAPINHSISFALLIGGRVHFPTPYYSCGIRNANLAVCPSMNSCSASIKLAHRKSLKVQLTPKLPTRNGWPSRIIRGALFQRKPPTPKLSVITSSRFSRLVRCSVCKHLCTMIA